MEHFRFGVQSSSNTSREHLIHTFDSCILSTMALVVADTDANSVGSADRETAAKLEGLLKKMTESVTALDACPHLTGPALSQKVLSSSCRRCPMTLDSGVCGNPLAWQAKPGVPQHMCNSCAVTFFTDDDPTVSQDSSAVVHTGELNAPFGRRFLKHAQMKEAPCL